MMTYRIGNYLNLNIEVLNNNIVENFDDATNVNVIFYNKNKPSVLLPISTNINSDSIDFTYYGNENDVQGIYQILVTYSKNNQLYTYYYQPIEFVNNSDFYNDLEIVEFKKNTLLQCHLTVYNNSVIENFENATNTVVEFFYKNKPSVQLPILTVINSDSIDFTYILNNDSNGIYEAVVKYQIDGKSFVIDSQLIEFINNDDNTENQVIEIIAETIGNTGIQINTNNLTYFGSSSTVPTTSNQIQQLTNIFNTNKITLSTGTVNNIFTIAVPAERTIILILDENAMYCDITRCYIKSQMLIQQPINSQQLYNVYTMQNAIPYSRNHNHIITIK